LKAEKAGTLLDAVLSLKPLQNDAVFWRYASGVADDLGRKQTALVRLEQAMQLEFETLSKVINAAQLRANYTGLMNRYEELIKAAATLETTLPEDLFARIIRAADQWRSLEDDSVVGCHTTARLLMLLDNKDLARKYLTTRLAEHSGESSVWRILARTLTEQKQVDLADMAWGKAFAFEQTNPEILMEHANMLNAHGRTIAARILLKKIVDSNWQPRFEQVRWQAQNQLP